MKNMKYIAVVVMVLTVGCVPFVGAQESRVQLMIAGSTSITGSVRVNVPFAFSVNGQTLEAGEYYLSPNGDSALTIKNASGTQAVVVLTNRVNLGTSTTAPKLVFNRYGNTYFLAQSWLRYSDEGRKLDVSLQEKQLAQQYHGQDASVEAGM